MDSYRKDYEFLPYRVKFFGNKVLIFTYFGTWISLNKDVYEKVRFGKIDDALYSELESAMVIKTKGNSDKITEYVSCFHWNLGVGPTLHIIVPTLRCNQTCKYCYALRATEEEEGCDMDEATAKATVDFIFSTPSPMLSIEFTGGEPLLKYDIIKFIITYARELAKESTRTLLFSIVTNGTLMTDEMIQFFKDNKVGLCISLDGPEDIHNDNRKFTRNPRLSNHKEVINCLDKLNAAEYASRNALPVITKQSLPRWKEIVDEYILRGFKVLRFKYMSNFGFASGNWEAIGYSAEEYIEQWKAVIDYMVGLNKKGIEISEQLTAVMIKKIQGINPGYCELDMPCGAVMGQILYNYDGKIYTCDEGRTMEEFSIGTVTGSTYADVINSPVTKTLISLSSNQSFGCPDCAYFRFCGTCPLESYKSQKTFMVNYPSSYRCKIHKAMFDYLFEKMVTNPDYDEAFKKWIHYRDNQLRYINDSVDSAENPKC